MDKWYEPGEDSYTMVDLIKDEAITNSVVIDLGCSTGIITDSMDPTNIVLSLDLNVAALQQLQEKNTVRTDLLRGINQSKIDAVIFNPPYVPDFDCPILGGGKCGREVIDRFIEEASAKIVYLLIIEANNPIEVAEKLASVGYNVELKKVRKVVGETIIIFKCVKTY